MHSIGCGATVLAAIVLALIPRTICGLQVIDKCDLARQLHERHHLARDQVRIWVCIAQHQSHLQIDAANYEADGTGYHGLYQISSRYWCGPHNPCQLDCSRLRDRDLSDDLACIALIFAEHERLSGIGYSAWTAYGPHCSVAPPPLDECFGATAIASVPAAQQYDPVDNNSITGTVPLVVVDKVYDRCELARELRFVHRMPREQIATWVCIARHESEYRTAVVGRRNADGSADHGLFQISDIYWCSPPGKGWACGVTCAQLRDSDLTDDVRCIRTIHAEHQRLSGDGFNAWTVYQPHCRGWMAQSYTDGCFSEAEEYAPLATTTAAPREVIRQQPEATKTAKVYTRCELAAELRDRHGIPESQIATWVCIAHHESRFNTSAVGRLNVDGSADHGLFQISDIYWCSPPGKGWACGLSCDRLEDSDIGDDVECIRKIHAEHQRLSGDGFNAWTVYQPYCRGRAEQYLSGCSAAAASWSGGGTVKNVIDDGGIAKQFKKKGIDKVTTHVSSVPPATGKVFERCELARELHQKHAIPMEQIATWVCIAKHESRFNTSAVGHLNADGSGDHGLFQISDIYWCSPPGKGWVCGLSCAKLEDSDIGDDVQCMRKIHAEHQRLSGDGFNAWAVYQPYCRGQSDQYVQGCFAGGENIHRVIPLKPSAWHQDVVATVAAPARGKVFSRCELAKELRDRHRLPADQIATWVCIAQHESRYNTSAVGRLNGDGSADHGLFQISDIYWCSPPGKGWACGLSCKQLEDADITDDVECIRKIHAEHQRLSGDGFKAWTVYERNCKTAAVAEYTSGCFAEETTTRRTTAATPTRSSTRLTTTQRATTVSYATIRRTQPTSQTTVSTTTKTPSKFTLSQRASPTTSLYSKTMTTTPRTTTKNYEKIQGIKSTHKSSYADFTTTPKTIASTTLRYSSIQRTTQVPTASQFAFVTRPTIPKTTSKPTTSRYSSIPRTTQAPTASQFTFGTRPTNPKTTSKPTTPRYSSIQRISPATSAPQFSAFNTKTTPRPAAPKPSKATINPFAVYFNQFTTKKPITHSPPPTRQTAASTRGSASSNWHSTVAATTRNPKNTTPSHWHSWTKSSTLLPPSSTTSAFPTPSRRQQVTGPTTKHYATTTASTRKPTIALASSVADSVSSSSSSSSAERILAKQTATKLAFDRLFDMFLHAH